MYEKGPAQKRIMMLYGICVIILLVNVGIANMYHEILGLAAILIALFFSFFQFSALMMTWRRSPAEVYEKKSYSQSYYWAGQLNPAANGVASGIMMMIAVLVATPVTDWEWLGVPVINPLIILWAINAVISMYTGIYAAKNGYGKLFGVKSPEYRKPGEYE